MPEDDAEPAHPQDRIIEDLVYEHVHVSGDTFQIDAHTWAIHGFIPVDGDVIMAEFDTLEDAEAAIERLSGREQGRP